MKKNRPSDTVSRNQDGACNQIYSERFVRPKAEAGFRDIDNHERKTAEPPYLFEDFNRLVFPKIFEALPVL